jgi:hypothetical protein
VLTNVILNRVFLTKLFDHKCVTLSFFRHNKSINRHRINPCVYSHPRFDAILRCTVAETHLQHADPDQPGVNVEAGLLEIGEIVTKIREINEIEFEIEFSGRNNLLDMQLAGKIADLNELVENLPDPVLLNNIVKVCSHDIF